MLPAAIPAVIVIFEVMIQLIKSANVNQITLSNKLRFVDYVTFLV